MKNKKLANLSIALGLSIITLISAISAYFTDADTATNEFTIGKVSLDLQEPNWVPPQNITPNQVIKKDPQILNNGINDEFVFLTVKVPIKNIITAELDGTRKPVAETELFTYKINENWIQIGKNIKTTDFVTRIYAYAKNDKCIALKKGETTNPLFDTVKVCNAIEDQGLELTKEQIIINAYGIQINDINDINGIDKTVPMDVWEVINNQRNVSLKPEKENVSVLISSNDFEEIKNVFKNATAIHFVKDRPIPEGTQILDYSETQDGSILAWQEGNTVYINSENKILANEDCSRMFYNFSNLREISFENFDTSKVTNMSYMFYGCKSLTDLDLNSFNTSNVTTMKDMFYDCTGLTSLNLSSFDTSNVTDMYAMFLRCANLTSLDVSNFDTSNVTNISYMFYGCKSLTDLDVNNFNTSNVTTMSHMFLDCIGLTSLNLSNFDTSKVTIMYAMFDGCTNLTSLDLRNFDTSNVITMGYMFSDCTSLTNLDISSFNTSNVTTMDSMFEYCTDLTSLDVSNFDTSNVTNMDYMFDSCTNLISLDLSNFDTSNVTGMCGMFYVCTNLTDLDLSSFDTSKVTNMGYMFDSCLNLTTLKVSKTRWQISSSCSVYNMWRNCKIQTPTHRI